MGTPCAPRAATASCALLPAGPPGLGARVPSPAPGAAPAARGAPAAVRGGAAAAAADGPRGAREAAAGAAGACGAEELGDGAGPRSCGQLARAEAWRRAYGILGSSVLTFICIYICILHIYNIRIADVIYARNMILKFIIYRVRYILSCKTSGWKSDVSMNIMDGGPGSSTTANDQERVFLFSASGSVSATGRLVSSRFELKEDVFHLWRQQKPSYDRSELGFLIISDRF